MSFHNSPEVMRRLHPNEKRHSPVGSSRNSEYPPISNMVSSPKCKSFSY